MGLGSALAANVVDFCSEVSLFLSHTGCSLREAAAPLPSPSLPSLLCSPHFCATHDLPHLMYFCQRLLSDRGLAMTSR